ncbi:MAG: 2-oxoglutarate dehydrogenase E1 component [Moheibacter sp.]
MEKFSFLNAVHSEYISELYGQYQKFPDSVEPSWKAFFQGFDFASTSYNGHSLSDEISNDVITQVPEKVQKEFKVITLIDAYRTRGHLFTKTNPVRERRQYAPTLELVNFDLTEADLDETFGAGEILGIGGATTLRNIIDHLQNMYCDSIGVEYMYIRQPEKIKWIQNWLNANLNHPKLSVGEKERILLKLNEAVAFESFLHTKFVGQKRFSLEGNETLIPALDAVINRAAEAGAEEVVLGMAHRGRLNVLANIFKKSYSQIFSEFEGKEFVEDVFAGDVKYHLGSSTRVETVSGKEIKMNLAPNPSHLETVDAIVEGITRAKADNDYAGDYKRILPILIHGDAAVAGQGIVYEVVQMMNLDGYKTGGTIHIVVNNQVGFTTNYLDARSSTYCTDVAKTTLSPVLHVNADDAEAVVHALNFAADYRMRFGEDVFIDLLGYRKYGHNEGDEPRFTQPKLYSIIAKHPNPREIYLEHLIKEGVIGNEILEKKEKEFKQLLDENFDASKAIEKNMLHPFMPEKWEGFTIADEDTVLKPVDTKYPIEKLESLSETLTTIPNGKKFIRKIQRLLDQRKKMVEENRLDWGMAELLAYGSILEEGHDVRLSGEDVERGTFSHRHAVIKTEDAEEEVILLNHLENEEQGNFTVYNSLLSEYAVLGFDYGYAMAAPHTLTLWEAQFGDFANGAQIVIDQYISAAEDKWKIQNGLVMLLPHGYEGQGAEHSSARMERFLQLSAQANMILADCTTPANFFHLLRRQTRADYRKPLIVFTPKSLLRHPLCISTLNELADGHFQTLIDDETADSSKVDRIVFCTGKFYYDLAKKKEELNAENVAIIRLEQLYPLDNQRIEELINKYTNHKKIIWAQEEPENMGAWSYILRKLRRIPFEVVSPKESASPASGSHHTFNVNYNKTINRVFE